ncbi:Uncharacterized protein dnm_083700 [Desulfonema magnum]|uniref:Uncharacterized protein n=1 Tax=Desulfonema magnum TaxID=45655 RepID=A0A975GSU5_9BACT|nr:Uncharacterized protein dnm_083700 [Desulfonema magnum]
MNNSKLYVFQFHRTKKSQIANPESQIPNPKSQIPNHFHNFFIEKETEMMILNNI